MVTVFTDVSIEDLIGVQTNGEKHIIKQVMEGKDEEFSIDGKIDGLINLAPILKPSVLEKAV